MENLNFFGIEPAPDLELTSLAYQGVAVTGAYWTVGGNETTLNPEDVGGH